MFAFVPLLHIGVGHVVRLVNDSCLISNRQCALLTRFRMLFPHSDTDVCAVIWPPVSPLFETQTGGHVQ